MARVGITQSEVFQAANELSSSGIKPTIEQIRAILKTGSNTTIALHLRKWHSLQNIDPTVGSGIKFPREMTEVLNKVWEELSEKANANIDQLKLQHEQAILDLQEELQKYKNNNKRWQDMHNKWQDEKKALNEKKMSLQNEIDELKTNSQEQTIVIEREQAKNQELLSRISELNRLFKQSQDNLEHFREAARTQRQEEQHKYEYEKQQLNLQIKQFQAEIVTLKTYENTLNNDNKSLKVTIEDIQRRLTEKNNETKITAEELNKSFIQVEILKNKISELNMENDHFKQLTSQDAERLIEKESEIKSLRSQLKYIEADLSERKQLIADFEKEKWHKLLKKEILNET